MASTSKQRQLDQWYTLVDNITKQGGVDTEESHADKQARIKANLKNYGKFFSYYFPHYAKTKCSRFHIRAANLLMKFRIIRLILEWYRGAAKSVHATVGYPLWLMVNDELNVMLLVSANQDKAEVLLSAIQAELQYNQRFINDFGEQMRQGSWEEGQFVTRNDKAFFALGLGQSPRGIRYRENRPDYIVADDLDTKERCKNPKRVGEAVEWTLEDLMECFSQGDKSTQRFVLANNRIHPASILVRVLKAFKEMGSAVDNIVHMRVNALDKNGNPTWPENGSKKYWEKKKSITPHRSFQRELMNNPIMDGTIFRQEDIQWKKMPMKTWKDYDAIEGYADLSYKANGDTKALRIWAKKGREFHLLTCYVRRSTVRAVAKWLYDFHESLPDEVKDKINYSFEASFIQDTFLEEFLKEGDDRGYWIYLTPDKRKKGDKYDRVEKLSGIYEQHYVFYNENEKESADMIRGMDQVIAFERGSGANDDAPDADEGAIYNLQLKTKIDRFEPVIGTKRTKRGGY